MNLGKLIHVPGVGVADVEEALIPHFFGVFVEERKEPFFTHHVRCIDCEGKIRLIIRFGWSEQVVGWVFEILAQRQHGQSFKAA